MPNFSSYRKILFTISRQLPFVAPLACFIPLSARGLSTSTCLARSLHYKQASVVIKVRHQALERASFGLPELTVDFRFCLKLDTSSGSVYVWNMESVRKVDLSRMQRMQQETVKMYSFIRFVGLSGPPCFVRRLLPSDPQCCISSGRR